MADSSGSVGEDRDAKISMFCNITGVDSERAQFYLESANWDLQLATQSFYEHSEDEMMGPSHVAGIPGPLPMPVPGPMINEPPPPMSQPLPQPPLVQTDSDSEGSDKEAGKAKKKPVVTSSSKFGTLDSLKARESSDSSGEEGQAFYAGGSTRSGQQVLGPKRKEKRDNLVKEMFDSAKEHGAEPVDASERSKNPQRVMFQGSGYRLGTEETGSVQVAAPSTAQPDRRVEIILKMWKNGFSVDDGPLRSYDDPESHTFLQSIRLGQIPDELIKIAKGGQINLDMENHSHEDYVKPKKKLQAFGGEGHRLGSPALDLTTPKPNLGTEDPKKSEEEAQKAMDVKDSEPSTKIQIRLTDGSRLVLKLNHTQTVGDIRKFICLARPVYAATPFVLMTTFPNKELKEENQTIKDANLLNAQIVQRLV